MKDDQTYDVAVIGSGAGGGTLAYELAMQGYSVLILERGGYVPREPENWDPDAVFGDGRYVSADTWRDGDGREFQPQVHYNVGGASKFYGAALYRLRPGDFSARETPDGVTGQWPLSYADMEPFYTRAEHMYQVHGRHGDDPTEGPFSSQYAYRPVSHEPYIAALSDHFTERGLTPFHSPNAVMLNEDDPGQGDSPCTRCQFCDGHPCPLLAKCDAETIAVRPILGRPNVILRTGMRAVELRMTERSVTKIVATTRGGELHSFSAGYVVLAAGAVNTASLLLHNHLGGDHAGRHYMAHTSKAMIAIGREPNPTRFQKTLAVNDWYDDLGNVQMLGKSNASAMRGESRIARLFPERDLAKVAAHAVDFWLTTEDVGLHDNRVTLDTDGKVKLAYEPTNTSRSRELARELSAALGRHYVTRHMDIPLAAVAHQAGTARMGFTPADSVTDRYGRVWGTDNLYVADASAFPSIGAVNPALTVMANALRVASHLEELI